MYFGTVVVFTVFIFIAVLLTSTFHAETEVQTVILSRAGENPWTREAFACVTSASMNNIGATKKACDGCSMSH